MISAKMHGQTNGFAVMEADELYFINGGSGISKAQVGSFMTMTGQALQNDINMAAPGMMKVEGGALFVAGTEAAGIGLEMAGDAVSASAEKDASKVPSGVDPAYSDCGVHNGMYHGASGPSGGGK
jgi:hypothetical protein